MAVDAGLAILLFPHLCTPRAPYLFLRQLCWNAGQTTFLNALFARNYVSLPRATYHNAYND
eukprot:10948738-Lingulodinium_polyedra.AAC.1